MPRRYINADPTLAPEKTCGADRLLGKTNPRQVIDLWRARRRDAAGAERMWDFHGVRAH